jgi:hypothetical protein
MVSPAMCCTLSSRRSLVADFGVLGSFSVDNSTHKTYARQIPIADPQCVCLNTENPPAVLAFAVHVSHRFTPSEVASKAV